MISHPLGSTGHKWKVWQISFDALDDSSSTFLHNHVPPELIEYGMPVVEQSVFDQLTYREVWLKALIGVEGNISNAEIVRSSGNNDVDQVVLASTDQYIFKPGTYNNRPQETWATWKVTLIRAAGDR